MTAPHIEKAHARSPARTHLGRWAITLVLLIGAWLLVKATLPEGSAQAPFPTIATIGEQASARNLVVTITDVQLAERVSDAEGWSADGTWLVVDLDAASVEKTVLLSHVKLVFEDRTFSETMRGETFARHRLIAGVPQSGSLAFELPADAIHSSATLELGAGLPIDGTIPLDGVIELEIDLESIPVESQVTLQENGWTR